METKKLDYSDWLTFSNLSAYAPEAKRETLTDRITVDSEVMIDEKSRPDGTVSKITTRRTKIDLPTRGQNLDDLMDHYVELLSRLQMAVEHPYEQPLLQPTPMPETFASVRPRIQAAPLLNQERQSFLAMRNDLLQQFPGQWVAILGNSVVASGGTRWDVIQTVACSVGKRPVLIEQVTDSSFDETPAIVEVATPFAE